MNDEDQRPNGPDLAIEEAFGARLGSGRIAGVDEAGRGPWAGPLVAAAVVLDRTCVPQGLDDSKKLTAQCRELLYAEILASADVGVGIAEVDEIDEINVQRANDLAMLRAIDVVAPRIVGVIYDGNRVPIGNRLPARAVVGGDGLALGVAAASIVAKVTRDRIMERLCGGHPGYGWRTNRGYGTAEHRAALKRLGITVHHRMSFRPIFELLCEENNRSN